MTSSHYKIEVYYGEELGKMSFTHEFFEDASKEFMRGKIRHGHMIYYVCEATLKSGKPCGRRAVQDPFQDRLCTQHLRCQSKPEEPEKIDEPKRRSCRIASSGAETRQYSRSEARLYSRFGPSHGDGGPEGRYSRFGRRLISTKI
jgi:hypothetical protein